MISAIINSLGPNPATDLARPGTRLSISTKVPPAIGRSLAFENGERGVTTWATCWKFNPARASWRPMHRGRNTPGPLFDG